MKCTKFVTFIRLCKRSHKRPNRSLLFDICSAGFLHGVEHSVSSSSAKAIYHVAPFFEYSFMANTFPIRKSRLFAFIEIGTNFCRHTYSSYSYVLAVDSNSQSWIDCLNSTRTSGYRYR